MSNKYPKFNMPRRIVNFLPCLSPRLCNLNKTQHQMAICSDQNPWSQPWLPSLPQSLYPVYLLTLTFYLQGPLLLQPLLNIPTATFLVKSPSVVLYLSYRSLLTFPPVIYSPRSGQYSRVCNSCHSFAQNLPRALVFRIKTKVLLMLY